MMVLPSFVRLWSSYILFLRGGASSVGTASMLLVYVACGSVARGLRWRFLNMSCRVPGLRFVPFCRLRAAVLAVVSSAKLRGVGRAGASVLREACLEESSRHGGTAGRFKRAALISRAQLIGGAQRRPV